MPAFILFLILAIFVDTLAAFAQDSSSTPYKEKQILILIGPHYGLPMLEAITPAIVSTLTENGFSLDDIFVEFLDLHRHQEPQHRSNILALLETKLKDRSIGMIIAVNQGAVDFVAKEGKNLLAGVPMLIPILEELPEWEGEPRKLITLTSRQDAEGTLGYALALFPETKGVLVIMGKDDQEAPFLAPVLKALDDLPKKLQIETTADLPYEEMLERAAILPRDTIALYGSVFRDVTGRSFVPAEVAARVAETANRPVFAFRDMHIVQGLTGGSVTVTSDLGEEAARISLEYLAGNLHLVHPVTSFDIPNAPLFDWRQLKRWGADVGALPAGTIFLNRPPTLWSQHKEAVIIALASIILLSFLVVALLVANRRQRAAIRERKQAEAERENLQAQFNQAQKMESIGRLAGGVAHDFNNMLGVILGYTEMVLERVPPTEPLHADLEELQKAALRSVDLTRQLLAFARKQTVAHKVLDLNESITSMLKMLERLIGEDIDLLWEPGHGLWPVKMDPAQIDQILANLCVNARDAIADVGKVTIETGNIVFEEEYCKEHAGFLPGEYTMLRVSDNGCGMDAETLTLLFEPFFTTKELGKGTGLGLAAVYGVVKQNNGFINVYSEPGQGTTFKIYLPRHAAKAAETKEPRSQAAERGSETILLVEEEPAGLRMTTKMLERLGYTVLAAPTPGEAIRLAQEHAGRIDLVMTDVVMPEMNGRDLAKNLLSIYPEMRRLFMSGYVSNVIAHHGVLDEGVHFIQKPFSKGDLVVKVRDALKG